MVHERKITSGKDLSHKIQSYLLELEGVREKKLTFTSTRNQGRGESMRDIIQFDAAFDIRISRLALGLVVQDQKGVIKASKSILHSNISSPLIAEACACLEATKLGIEMVINKCQTTVWDKSIIRAIIKDIQ
ncbi:hypothetical protein ERO13_D10G091850v2, partial [Gossypium hirsutum]